MASDDAPFDLAIIGGGINGCGIARDAAGRGARLLLLEQDDLASGTSSASTKLIHGGLRYLEHMQFGLVREALKERETLWGIAPHVIAPLRFVLPHRPELRAGWMLRAGLWLYDHLGARGRLPGTRTIDLAAHPAGSALKAGAKQGWEYSDCRVDDSRLVILNARDAADRGATVLTRHRLVGAERGADRWRLAVLRTDGSTTRFSARALVNAAGPAALEIIDLAGARSRRPLRKVRGSHIVVPRLFDHDFAYLFQLPDRRIIFAIPYECDFTLIGTTDERHDGPLGGVAPTDAEIDYLCAGANQYFRRAISPADVVWRFAGVRALVDSGHGRPEAASRGYRLDLDAPSGAAPLLSVLGGKITTYRRLAEEALDRLAPHIPQLDQPRWTSLEALPGGDFAVGGRDQLAATLADRHPFLTPAETRRIAAAYGTLATTWLRNARTRSDLGQDFGGGLSAAEADYCIDREWALTAADMLWRRSKLGLRVGTSGAAALQYYMASRNAPAMAGGVTA